MRADNMAALRALGFQPAEWLPTVREGLRLRPARDRAARAFAMLAAYAWVSAPPAQVTDGTVRGFVERNGLEPFFSANEAGAWGESRNAAQKEFGGVIGWTLEALWSVAWTLGFEHRPPVEGGFIDEEVTGDLLFDFLPLLDDGQLDEWVEDLGETPSEAEVKGLEDLFYCAHNAVRSAQLGGSTVPAGFDPLTDGGCVHERRHGLTWCLSDCAWDETDLST